MSNMGTMVDAVMPAGWGFFDGSSLCAAANEGEDALPDFPEGLRPARQRAHVIAFLIAHPSLLRSLKAADLMARYDLPRNRAAEMLGWARDGHVPGPQGKPKNPRNQHMPKPTERRAA